MQRAYWDLFSDEPLCGSILIKCILGDRLQAVPLFVLLTEFGQFSSAMPFVYTIIISPLDCFLSRSCVTNAAYCGWKKPKGEINNVHSGYPTLVLNLNLVCETFRA